MSDSEGESDSSSIILDAGGPPTRRDKRSYEALRRSPSPKSQPDEVDSELTQPPDATQQPEPPLPSLQQAVNQGGRDWTQPVHLGTPGFLNDLQLHTKLTAAIRRSFNSNRDPIETTITANGGRRVRGTLEWRERGAEWIPEDDNPPKRQRRAAFTDFGAMGYTPTTLTREAQLGNGIAVRGTQQEHNTLGEKFVNAVKWLPFLAP